MQPAKNAPSVHELLRGSPLLSALTPEQQSFVAVNSKMAHVDRGEIIWTVGATVDFFGVVASGFVKMSRLVPGGHEVTTEIMGPGQVFGLLGAIEGVGCPQTAKAVTPTWYLRIRKAEFLPIYEQSTHLKERLVLKTSSRLRQSFDMIAHLSVGSVEQRIAAVLLLLSASFGEECADGVILNVPLTRQDIGEIAGTTVETTIRVMSKWQKLGWVRTESRQITLCEADRLMSLVRGS